MEANLFKFFACVIKETEINEIVLAFRNNIIRYSNKIG